MSIGYRMSGRFLLTPCKQKAINLHLVRTIKLKGKTVELYFGLQAPFLSTIFLPLNDHYEYIDYTTEKEAQDAFDTMTRQMR